MESSFAWENGSNLMQRAIIQRSALTGGGASPAETGPEAPFSLKPGR